MYQILSESTGFCGRYDKKHFGVFFGSQCILEKVRKLYATNTMLECCPSLLKMSLLIASEHAADESFEAFS